MQKLNSFRKFLTFFISAVVIVSVWATSASGSVQLTERSKLALDGIGPIRVGMTVDEASRAAGVKLVTGYDDRDEYLCSYFTPQDSPKGIAFMVTKGRIARVDNFSNKRVTTIKGARIGDTEDRIISLYPGQIQVTKHPLTNQNYLIFVPKDAADKNYRIIFETSKNRVKRFRSGKIPEVESIEGCF